MLLGFDFSFYNRDEQWSRISKDARFILHRASEGVTGGDNKLIPRLRSFDPTKPFGIYHVVRPKQNKWEDEFKHFCDRIDECRAIREVGIALDLECSDYYVPYNSPESVKIWLCNLINALHVKYNRPVMCYMGDLYPDSWYEAFKQAGGVFWIARWQCQPKHITHDATIWQADSHYQGESLDVDYFLKDEETLEQVFGFTNPYDKHRVTPEQIDQAAEIIALATLDGKFGRQPERKELWNNLLQGKVNELVKEGR